LVAQFRQILQDEKNLTEIVQLVGTDSLGEDQKVTLEVAKVIREDFLQQNGFTEYDYTCPMVKCSGMMRCIVKFYELAMKTVRTQGDSKITWGKIKHNLKDQYTSLTRMKFIIPSLDESEIKARLDKTLADIVKGFQDIQSF